MTTPISLAIVLCTFNRNDLLREALESLVTQTIPDGVEAGVTVVDNSNDGAARATVESFAGRWRIPVRWIEAHPPNISVARNVGVAKTSEPFLVFLDDDETCEPGWFEALIAAMRACPADVLVGPVLSDYERPDLATPATRQLFTRALDLPLGAPLYAYGPNKQTTISLATNNAVFSRAATLDETGPFDLAFGDGGGEDFDLFCRIQQRGRSVRWMPDAKVRARVSATRCDPVYQRKRAFAGGQAYAAAIARLSARPLLERWRLRAVAAVQLALLTMRAPLAWAKGGHDAADHASRVAGVLGKLSFGGIFPLYRANDPRSG